VAPRASWKGFLKLAELTCPVALYAAVSTAERLSFHTLNRETGNRVRRQFIDKDTGDVVERDEQVKGYEIGPDKYVVLEPDEVAQAIPENDKTILIDSFIACEDIDDVYFDRPYYLTPNGPIAEQAFAVVREGMRQNKAVALAQALLFRRVRTLLIRSYDCGLIATTLNFDYEVRSAEDAFDDVPPMKITGEMLDLAKHIIATKKGSFDPKAFDDRYEAALAELVRAKLAGKPVKAVKKAAPGKVIDLMDALRQSAASSEASSGKSQSPREANKTGTKASVGDKKKSSQPSGSRRRNAG
jgi:DNA end-binding protein Ku